MNEPPHFILMTLTDAQGEPSLAEAANQLGVAPEHMDKTFGVVPIDPEQGTYAVQVRSDKLPSQSQTSTSKEYRGPWSNPKIEPFGPVKN